MNILSIEHLTRVYGTGDTAVTALNDVSFTVEAGEFIAIIGSSGSGKSTLMHLMGGVDRPTSGTVKLQGQDIFARNDEQLAVFRRREVGLIYQFYNLIPVLDVVENMTLPVLMDGRSVNEQRLSALVRALGLTGREHCLPNQLSGGQQQRVALARMLAARPGILMFDEPFSALDSYLKSALEQNLLDVFSVVDRTVLYVSHDIDEACRLCDRICVMHNGCVEESGTAGELIARPQTLAGMRLTGCKNTSRARKVSDTVVEALDWGMTFDMGREVPDDVAYLGVRARHIHRDRARAAGELGRNSFDLHVARVSDARFERLVLLEPPLGGSRSRIQWKVDILDAPTGSLPEAGETLRLHFDASRLLLVNR